MELNKLINFDFLNKWIQLDKYNDYKSTIEFLRNWTYGKILSIHCLRLNYTRKPTDEEIISNKYRHNNIIPLNNLIQPIMSNEKYMSTLSQEYINDLNSSKTQHEIYNKYFNITCNKCNNDYDTEDDNNSNKKYIMYNRKTPLNEVIKKYYCLKCINRLQLDITTLNLVLDINEYNICDYCINDITSTNKLYYTLENDTYDLCENCYNKLDEMEKNYYEPILYKNNPLEQINYPYKIFYSPDCTTYYKVVYIYDDYIYTLNFLESCCNVFCKIYQNNILVNELIILLNELLELNNSQKDNLYDTLQNICFTK